LFPVLVRSDRGNTDADTIPKAFFPDMSAVTRREDKQEPVMGSTTVMVPPPPVGESEMVGFVVETHSTCLSSDIARQNISQM
jgi:hypothetical protein